MKGTAKRTRAFPLGGICWVSFSKVARASCPPLYIFQLPTMSAALDIFYPLKTLDDKARVTETQHQSSESTPHRLMSLPWERSSTPQPATPPSPKRREAEGEVLTVTQITHKIKYILEESFGPLLIQGEVSNFRHQSSGHLYFSLKDATCQLNCVMFRNAASQLDRLPQDGDHLMVRGELNLYPPRGSYQLIIHELAAVGLGDLLLRYEKLKQTLAKRGWFDPSHKKPLPPFPRRIGVVTSPTGAALQDILNILHRRHAGFDLLLNPVRVQGKEAAGEIAQAITQFNQLNNVDVLIVGRGGGSLEDLWPFNEEVVAQAIFESAIPIISAVGHEIDTTLADLVADRRAPTPSAAAELVLAEKKQLLATLDETSATLRGQLLHRLRSTREQLHQLQRHSLLARPEEIIQQRTQAIDELLQRIDWSLQRNQEQVEGKLKSLSQQLHLLHPAHILLQKRERFHQLAEALDRKVEEEIRLTKEQLLSLQARLKSIDPRHLLSRGYALLMAKKEGGVIRSVRELRVGQEIDAHFADGSAQMHVDQLIPQKEPCQ